jgi:hypothetical protein
MFLCLSAHSVFKSWGLRRGEKKTGIVTAPSPKAMCFGRYRYDMVIFCASGFFKIVPSDF